jgi:hypothetical protein
MERCRVCGKFKTPDQFNRDASRTSGFSSQCKECSTLYHKNRDLAKKIKAQIIRKNTNLKYHYGVTLDSYGEMLASQNGLCAICGRSPELFNRAFAVDHDHATNIVRGILCPDCNRGLGGFHDDPDLLRKAADYLTKIEPD